MIKFGILGKGFLTYLNPRGNVKPTKTIMIVAATIARLPKSQARLAQSIPAQNARKPVIKPICSNKIKMLEAVKITNNAVPLYNFLGTFLLNFHILLILFFYH